MTLVYTYFAINTCLCVIILYAGIVQSGEKVQPSVLLLVIGLLLLTALPLTVYQLVKGGGHD